MTTFLIEKRYFPLMSVYFVDEGRTEDVIFGMGHKILEDAFSEGLKNHEKHKKTVLSGVVFYTFKNKVTELYVNV